MSVTITSCFLKSPFLLEESERPIRAVKIIPSGVSGRRAFHLGLLLDVSGSMKGVGINAVKTTLELLIDTLVDGDSLTLISYSSEANILAQGVVISDSSRPSLRTIVEDLRADGGTNLEAALTALHDLSHSAAPVTIDAAFILTDGHINQGRTSSIGLTRLLIAAVPAGTPVYTLGFGADHNSRMLRDMALRSRGSYTYADAEELIPATIADIISGLATEVGRCGRLTIPTGWQCLEINAEVDSTEFNIGVLVAEKEQWIVLMGPPGPCSTVDDLTFTWKSHTGVTHTETCTSYNDFDAVHVAEQHCRVRVATVQAAVQELIEAGTIDAARSALQELGAELDASPAKDRSFVISLRAQIDEMIEALQATAAYRMPPHSPGGLRRAAAGVWPSLAPVLSRMASNTAALGAQRGILSHVSSVDPSASAAAGESTPARVSGVVHTFSSPVQRRETRTMAQRYSQLTSTHTASQTQDPDDNMPSVDPTTLPTILPSLE
jgi:Mg-chelatase subunit ChlD